MYRCGALLNAGRTNADFDDLAGDGEELADGLLGGGPRHVLDEDGGAALRGAGVHARGLRLLGGLGLSLIQLSLLRFRLTRFKGNTRI